MSEDTYSVSQVARNIGKAPNTIRSWTGIYSNHLSDNARPEGDERRYNDADVALLQTVKVLRDQREPHKLIIPRIAEDERLEPPPASTESPPERNTEDASTSITTERDAQLAREFGQLQGEFNIIKQERDMLRDQLNDSQESHLTAETRAVAAEARLDMIWRRHWYQIWRPSRPPDAD